MREERHEERDRLHYASSPGAEASQQEAKRVTAGEFAYLDLTTAERAAWKLYREVSTVSMSWPDSSKVGFRLVFAPEKAYSVRAGDSLEIVVRLENISTETIAIPWKTNWESILGKGPEKLSEQESFPENFPEGWIWATLSGRALLSAEAEGKRKGQEAEGTECTMLCSYALLPSPSPLALQARPKGPSSKAPPLGEAFGRERNGLAGRTKRKGHTALPLYGVSPVGEPSVYQE